MGLASARRRTAQRYHRVAGTGRQRFRNWDVLPQDKLRGDPIPLVFTRHRVTPTFRWWERFLLWLARRKVGDVFVDRSPEEINALLKSRIEAQGLRPDTLFVVYQVDG